MPDIFLSYSREDQPVARLFAEGLQHAGFSVWWDQALTAGQEFDQVTETALEEARAVVVLWSTHSVHSRWVRAEATQAQANGRLVPVMIETCKRPIMFELTHTADLVHWKGDARDSAWVSFLAGLRQFQGGDASAKPVTPHVASAPPHTSSRTRMAIIAGVALAVLAAGFGLWRLNSREASASSGASFAETLAQMSQLVRSDSYGAAFMLGSPLVGGAEAKASTDFQELWQQVVSPMKPLVTEEGAKVYFRPYDQPDSAWIEAGTTPLAQAVAAPRGFLRIKVEKQGFRTGNFVIANPGPSVEFSAGDMPPDMVAVPLPLIAEGTLPEDMVLVPHTDMAVAIGGITRTYPGGLRFDIPAFAISRTEVSNREFKEFVDTGGYDTPAFWQGLKFRDGDRELSWAQARARFVDTTQRPGPAGWQLGSYVDGQADLPVGGISWYEAMAYARFRDKVLPTLHHWVRAAEAPYDYRYSVAVGVALTSHFDASGPISVQDEVGLGPWGTVNTAGNAREWVSSFAGTQALAMGAAWNDYSQLANQAYSAPPMDRSAQNGMRLMQLLPGTGIDPQLLAPVPPVGAGRTYRSKPVGDEAFEAIRPLFIANHAKPEKITAQQVEESPLWTAEEVVLQYAGPEIETLYIIRPRNHRGLMQPVLYGPPGDCCIRKRPNRDALQLVRAPADSVVRSGRALVIPIWDSSYEKFVQFPADSGAAIERATVLLRTQRRQAGRVLDYLQTLPDIESAHPGYLGFSSGSAFLAPSVLAMEERFRAAVLISGGLAQSGDNVPVVIDRATYVPRIRIPVLMINGRFDLLFQLESSQKPMFNMLGTPAADKKYILYDVGHVDFPPNSIAKDIGDWFDKYLNGER